MHSICAAFVSSECQDLVRGPLSEWDVHHYLHVWCQAAFCGASLQPRLWGGRRRKKGFVVEGTSHVPFETWWRQRNQEFCVTKNGQSLHLLRKLRTGGGCTALLRHRNVTSFILHGVVCIWMGLVGKFFWKRNRFFSVGLHWPWFMLVAWKLWTLSVSVVALEH